MSEDPSMTKKLKLTDLPGKVIGLIAEKTGDWESIMNMSKTNTTLQEAMVDQQWKCTKCSDLINLNADAATTTTFSCGVCGNVYCGQRGHEKRFCTPNRKCSGCGTIECHSCVCDHLDDCAMCGRQSTSFCKACQGKCEKSCIICGFANCQHHRVECAKCGMKTCEGHNRGPVACWGCEKSYCESCVDFDRCPHYRYGSGCMGYYCNEDGSNCYAKLIRHCFKCKETICCASCMADALNNDQWALVRDEVLVCINCYTVENLEHDEDEDDEEDEEEENEHGDAKKEEEGQE
jgi:hypothetical protein